MAFGQPGDVLFAAQRRVHTLCTTAEPARQDALVTEQGHSWVHTIQAVLSTVLAHLVLPSGTEATPRTDRRVGREGPRMPGEVESRGT